MDRGQTENGAVRSTVRRGYRPFPGKSARRGRLAAPLSERRLVVVHREPQGSFEAWRELHGPSQLKGTLQEVVLRSVGSEGGGCCRQAGENAMAMHVTPYTAVLHPFHLCLPSRPHRRYSRSHCSYHPHPHRCHLQRR